MKLRVVGCSPSYPNPGGAHSGYLVQDGSRRLLVDCGPGVLARLRELDGWPRVDAVVLSHWHHDHWGDLIPWVWGHRTGPGAGHDVTDLWCPPPGRSQLDEFGALLSGEEDMFGRTFRMHDYEVGVPFEAAGFEIDSVGVPHYTYPSCALRVTSGGRTLAYSGDCGPCDQLVDLARDADLFVCEATIEDGTKDSEPRTHMAADEAIAAFEASGAKRLLLTHRPAELVPPAGCEVAREGLEIEL